MVGSPNSLGIRDLQLSQYVIQKREGQNMLLEQSLI